MSGIPRPEKILVAMLQLSRESNQPLDYEDIVVTAWKFFPEDFGLRKYVRDYPDSSDIHKPLYGPLKSRGFVLSANKKFKLTDKGREYAIQLDKVRQGLLSFDQVATTGSTYMPTWKVYVPKFFEYMFIKRTTGKLLCAMKIHDAVTALIQLPWPSRAGPVRKGKPPAG
jgi:hypothetical protein